MGHGIVRFILTGLPWDNGNPRPRRPGLLRATGEVQPCQAADTGDYAQESVDPDVDPTLPPPGYSWESIPAGDDQENEKELPRPSPQTAPSLPDTTATL